MNLRQQAEADLRSILTDSADGFGWPVKLYDPSGNFTSLTGFSADIAQLIDPDTGQAVSGRRATIALPMRDIKTAGLKIPRAIADRTSKPWWVQFDDILGDTYNFKIVHTNPDRTIGCLTCTLELYQP